WLWSTPGTPRRSSHKRYSWLNFIFRGYKKLTEAAVLLAFAVRDLTPPPSALQQMRIDII
ncbi:hypothetical protein, partial [Klebsiella pneumoniae]|uniref:hypothetical protein n=1 Tax=Klebsiella pneumoniae TaxID=573 RepID=UPI002FF304DB